MFFVQKISKIEQTIANNFLLFGISIAILLSLLNAASTLLLFVIQIPSSHIESGQFVALISAIMFPIVLSIEMQTRYAAAIDLSAAIAAREHLLTIYFKSTFQQPESRIQACIDTILREPKHAQMLTAVQQIVIDHTDLLYRIRRIGASYAAENHVRTTMYMYEFIIVVIVQPIVFQTYFSADTSYTAVLLSAFTTCLLQHAWLQSSLLALIFNTSHATNNICSKY